MHHLPHPRSTLLALTSLAMLSGCAGASSEATPTASPTTPASASAAAPEGATVPPPQTVALLSEGSGPRRVLRFDYPDGASARFAMEMDTTVRSAQGGAPATPIVMPTVVFEASAGPYLRYPDGTTAYSYRYDSVEVRADPGSPQEAMATVMQPLFAPMTRIRGQSAFTDRGQVVYVYNDLPADLDPQVAQTVKDALKSMTQVMPVLPEEPVGVGARWSTTSPIESESFRFVQTSTFTLTELAGDRVTLEVAIAQQAPLPQELPSGAPGVKVVLTGFSGSGTATTTLSLRDLALRSTMTYAIRMENVAQAEGQEVPVTLDMEIAIRTETTPVDAR